MIVNTLRSINSFFSLIQFFPSYKLWMVSVIVRRVRFFLVNTSDKWLCIDVFNWLDGKYRTTISYRKMSFAIE
jgi:hypothetical protein